jgi:hypothetical protein
MSRARIHVGRVRLERLRGGLRFFVTDTNQHAPSDYPIEYHPRAWRPVIYPNWIARTRRSGRSR